MLKKRASKHRDIINKSTEKEKNIDVSVSLVKKLIPYHFIDDLKDLSFVKKIILFGSRARGDNGPKSDIDLSIECDSIENQDWLKVIEIIDNADTLLKIDCIRLNTVPILSELNKNILKEGRVLYAKN